MIVISCQHENSVRCGKDRKGNQRYLCNECGKYFMADVPKPLGDMRTSLKDASQALGMILEGLSIRSVERLTGIHRDTIDDLILVVGENCQRLLETTVKNVEVKDVQLDEIWSFVGMKEKHRVSRGYSPEFGDSWTFIGIERETKLILAHHIGNRDSDTCWAFLLKLKSAIGKGRFQLTTDGLRAYTSNVPFAFQSQVDFAQLIKNYASSQEVTRYSPATIINIEKLPIFGAAGRGPDKHQPYRAV